ncbi:uncharacterized protein LOC122911113 isoform X2 [Neovison vison]|uniref:uncharacterized protein LOC122911113 isoform X2 n=1 Tax=Neovison vison TaxID=452646 RepID=UPI001CF0B9E0|nr:uncharacterized protein LOC122911113 isoform X2 [Neogale vison]
MSACPGKQPLLAVWRKQRASQRRATQGGQWTWQDRHLCGRGPALSTQGRRTARYTVLSSWAPPELSSWVHLLLLPRVRLSTSAVVLAGPSCPALLHPALTQPGLSDCVLRVGTPDVRGRSSIFRVHLCPLKLDKSLQKDMLAGKLLVLVCCFPDCALRMSEELGQVYCDLYRRGEMLVGKPDGEATGQLIAEQVGPL